MSLLEVINITNFDEKNVPKDNRYGHTIQAYEDNLFIFGGLIFKFDNSNEFSVILECTNELLIFNTKKMVWCEPIQTKTKCPARHFHTCVYYKDKMYIFGGKGNSYLNDLHSYDFKGNWVQIKGSGTSPSARYGHSAIIYNNRMYIYGGYDINCFASNDLYSFDFETSKWSLIETAKNSPLIYHHKTGIYQDKMMVFGGMNDGKYLDSFYIYDFIKNEWESPNIGMKPEKRYGHQMFEYKNHIFVLGGCNEICDYEDIHFLDLSEMKKWEKVRKEEIEFSNFSATVFFTMSRIEDKIFTFGGIYKKSTSKDAIDLISEFRGSLRGPLNL